MRKLIVFILAVLMLSGCVPKVSQNGTVSSKGEFVKGAVARGFVNVPVYPKSKVVETYSSKEGWGGAFIADDSLNKVVNFYGSSLAQVGWEAILRKKSETNYVYEVKNDKYSGEIIINVASDGKTTAITVSAEPR